MVTFPRIALIPLVLTIGCSKSETPSQAVVDSTKSNMRIIHQAAEMYRLNNGNECPTIAALQEKGEISATSEAKDAWGSQYRIFCD